MPSPEWEDIDVFFDLDGFAVEVSIETGSGPITVPAIFDDPFLSAETGEYTIDGNQPSFTCPDGAAAAIARGDVVTVAGRTFRVSTVEPDGTGVTRVVMVEEA